MGFVDFFKWIWEQFEHYILPFIIIRIYERGVLLTFGKSPKQLNPGLRLKIPFIQEIYTEIITPDTLQGGCVHVTTADGKTILVSPIIEYIINDVIKWVVETNEARTNLHDILRSITADYLTDTTWDECKKKGTLTAIKNKLNKRIESMGAEVTQMMFGDIVQNRIILTQI
jgi:regulator of protease activity HflC (stomatin/prohibitin superfamily)